MTDSGKPKRSTTLSSGNISVFKVSDFRTLTCSDFFEPKTREDCYCRTYGWERSQEDLSSAMEDCQPLAWKVGSLYTEAREKLEYQIDDADELDHEELAKLEGKLASMPEEPEEGAGQWVLSIRKEEFSGLVCAAIRKWFASEPDWIFESEYIDDIATGQGAALSYFSDMESDLRKLLGVVIVEGDHPGSSYYAAELEGNIDNANKAALKAGIAIKFIPEKDA